MILASVSSEFLVTSAFTIAAISPTFAEFNSSQREFVESELADRAEQLLANSFTISSVVRDGAVLTATHRNRQLGRYALRALGASRSDFDALGIKQSRHTLSEVPDTDNLRVADAADARKNDRQTKLHIEVRRLARRMRGNEALANMLSVPRDAFPVAAAFDWARDLRWAARNVSKKA